MSKTHGGHGRLCCCQWNSWSRESYGEDNDICDVDGYICKDCIWRKPRTRYNKTWLDEILRASHILPMIYNMLPFLSAVSGRLHQWRRFRNTEVSGNACQASMGSHSFIMKQPQVAVIKWEEAAGAHLIENKVLCLKTRGSPATISPGNRVLMESCSNLPFTLSMEAFRIWSKKLSGYLLSWIMYNKTPI